MLTPIFHNLWVSLRLMFNGFKQKWPPEGAICAPYKSLSGKNIYMAFLSLA